MADPTCSFCGSNRIRARRPGEGQETDVLVFGPVWALVVAKFLDRRKTLICDRCGTPIRSERRPPAQPRTSPPVVPPDDNGDDNAGRTPPA